MGPEGPGSNVCGKFEEFSKTSKSLGSLQVSAALAMNVCVWYMHMHVCIQVWRGEICIPISMCSCVDVGVLDVCKCIYKYIMKVWRGGICALVSTCMWMWAAYVYVRMCRFGRVMYACV